MHPRALRTGAFLIVALLALSCADKKKKSSDDDDDDVRVTKEESSSSKKEDDGTVTITMKPSEVGAKYEHTTTVELSGEISIKNKVVPVKSTKRARYEVEILAVQDGRTAKQKVRYLSFEEKEEPASRKPPKAPIVDKVYIVERKGDAIEVTDEAGAPVRGGELEYLKDAYKKLGKPKKVPEILGKTRFKIGEELPELGAAIAEDEASDGDKVTVTSVRLTKRTGDVATFEYTMEGSTAKLEGAKLKIVVTAERSISSGLELKESGVVSIDGGDDKTGMKIKMSGKGEDTAKRL